MRKAWRRGHFERSAIFPRNFTWERRRRKVETSVPPGCSTGSSSALMCAEVLIPRPCHPGRRFSIGGSKFVAEMIAAPPGSANVSMRQTCFARFRSPFPGDSKCVWQLVANFADFRGTARVLSGGSPELSLRGSYVISRQRQACCTLIGRASLVDPPPVIQIARL